MIAIGSPFGTKDGVGFGVISGTKEQRYLCDGQYQILQTVWSGPKDASGVLVSLSGEVIGLIVQVMRADTA